MTQTFRSALLTACLLVGNSIVMAQVGPTDIHLKQSAEAKPESWERFVSPEGRFAILFPGTPTVSEEVIDHPAARLVLRKTQLRTLAEYGVIYADYPKSVIDKTSVHGLLDEGAKGALAEVNSQLLSISPISIGAYPGRLLKERKPNGRITHAMMILAGQRMYRVAITTPGEEGADPETVGFFNSIATKFLNSIEISSVRQDTVLASSTCPPEVLNCLPVADGTLNAKAISLPQPVYPPIARAAHATGTVEVQVHIDEQGVVISAASISGHPLLQAAAVAAARHARFPPTIVDNKLVKLAGIIRYNFALD